MGEEGVKLLGFWGSPFALRVKWGLKLKGIEYEYVEEDLLGGKKSDMLLKYNPVHKKIPVLVHGVAKPVAESLVILEYIEETWPQHYPLLPQDPLHRANARFWAKYADEKVAGAIFSTFSKAGEEQQKSAMEARESLKILESGLEGKRFFGGERIGFADIAAAWVGLWAQITEEVVKIKLIDEETMPLLMSWFQAVLEDPILKELVPPRDQLLALNTSFHKMLTSGPST